MQLIDQFIFVNLYIYFGWKCINSKKSECFILLKIVEIC